ncbi:MAG: endonuclease/exonuclease/phosphatase family protein [Thermoleophilia bacterium]|nr:endonuclease/exonuclease/phosphatase family protein [Thermoleophilia bacterium]
MALLVRTWNVYHGRSQPPTQRTYLRRMVELVTEDAPDVVALQEVPLWALGRLERWSGMVARWAVTVPALLLGPLARVVTELDPRRLRSLLTGQANVLLLGPAITPGEGRLCLLTPDVGRWEWLFSRGRQQRYCQALDVQVEERALTLANLHATNDPRLAPSEVARAAEFVARAERVVLCGDFNVRRYGLPGYSAPISGIDQILVRGLELARAPSAWPEARRTVAGRVLSDHAPVEAVIA